MSAVSLPLIVWDISDYENECICSEIDEYYAERLFFGVETHDVDIIKSFTNEHLRYLCRVRRLFPSEWSAPEQEKQTAYQRACLFGYTDIVQHMLSAGIKADQEFWCGYYTDIQRSAFKFACNSGSMSTIRALLQALSGDYAEHYKCRNRKNYCSSSFAKQHFILQNSWIEKSSFTASTSEVTFPIHFAIAQNNLELARLIVTPSYGELDTQNSWEGLRHGGFFPLHIACLFNRSVEMIKFLLITIEGNNNPLLLTSSAGVYADQMTNDETVIQYLRPQCLCIMEAMERKRLKDQEQMLSDIPYEIFIKPLSGKTLTLTVTGHMTSTELGEYIQTMCGLPLDRQKLLLNGHYIHVYKEGGFPVRNLAEYGIKKGSLLHIIWHNPD